jgi:hypothetical protein
MAKWGLGALPHYRCDYLQVDHFVNGMIVNSPFVAETLTWFTALKKFAEALPSNWEAGQATIEELDVQFNHFLPHVYHRPTEQFLKCDHVRILLKSATPNSLLTMALYYAELLRKWGAVTRDELVRGSASNYVKPNLNRDFHSLITALASAMGDAYEQRTGQKSSAGK